MCFLCEKVGWALSNDLGLTSVHEDVPRIYRNGLDHWCDSFMSPVFGVHVRSRTSTLVFTDYV